MDKTVREDDIARAIRNMDRAKRSEVEAAEASTALKVASSMGTNTPITLLVDIRQSMGELTEAVKVQQELTKLQINEDKRMHMESLAFMKELTDVMSKMQVAPMSAYNRPLATRTSVETEVPQRYYHGSDAVSMSAHVIACVLIHLERTASKSMTYTQTGAPDTMVMGLKDWAAVVNAVSKAESTQTPAPGKLVLPKMSSEEVKYVLGTFASTVESRVVSTKPAHFSDICAHCPGVTGCIEEVRLRMSKCPGLIGQQRSISLASLEFPYVKEDALIINPKPPKLGSKVVFDMVLKFTAKQKEAYASYILKDGMIPLNASRAVAALKAGI